MASGSADISVITPVLNEASMIRTTIESLQAQSYQGDVEYLFVDGGSTDATRSIIHEYRSRDPRIKLLDNPARLIPHALNIGLREATGRFVARMDAHTLYPPNYLEDGVKRLAGGDVAHVSGPQVAHGTDEGSRLMSAALGSRLGIGGAGYRIADGQEREVDSGFTGIWPRAVLDRQRGWDEAWRVNEDGELAARIRRDGGRIVCIPEMAALYVPRSSLRAVALQYWRYGQFRVKTSRRHPESMRPSHVLAPAVVTVTAAAVAAPRPLRRLARLALLPYLAALAVEAARTRDGGSWKLPFVWATMHGSWGAGFLLGTVRFGPPVGAVRSLLGSVLR